MRHHIYIYIYKWWRREESQNIVKIYVFDIRICWFISFFRHSVRKILLKGLFEKVNCPACCHANVSKKIRHYIGWKSIYDCSNVNYLKKDTWRFEYTTLVLETIFCQKQILVRYYTIINGKVHAIFTVIKISHGSTFDFWKDSYLQKSISLYSA